VIVAAQQTYMKTGDLKPDLIYYASDESKKADLRDVVSWRLIAKTDRGASVFIDASPTVTPNPDEPWRITLKHEWASAETATERRLLIEAEAMWPGGKPQTFPRCVVDVKPDLG
jgi:hypothetical protein